MAAAEGGLEENLGCDGFSGGLPLSPKFTSLSGSETIDSGKDLPRMGYEGLRILPREVLFSLDPAAFCFKKTIYVGKIGTS